MTDDLDLGGLAVLCARQVKIAEGYSEATGELDAWIERQPDLWAVLVETFRRGLPPLITRLRASEAALEFAKQSIEQYSAAHMAEVDHHAHTARALAQAEAREAAAVERAERAEALSDTMGDALTLASVAINAAYAQAIAERNGHDKIADRHDRTVQTGRKAIQKALEAALPTPSSGGE